MSPQTFTADPSPSALSVQLGPLRLSSPAILAPLAGYTDSAMRRLCRRHGAGMVFSEMLSGEGTRRSSEKTFKMAAFHPEERPYFVQFFATNPEQAAEAARKLSELEPDGLDLNFGCPVRKIIFNQGGSALLRDVPLLARIVEAVVKAAGVPVSVKMRSGWDHRSLNAVEIARAVADAGAAWVTVHARTRSEFYEGRAHWEWIGEVKAAVSIPVVGNGDVRRAQDAVRLMDFTHCDAVMIGRAAIGYPFIFREVNHLLQHGQPLAPATPRERCEAARQQLQWMAEERGERRAVLEFRKHLLAYVRGLPGSVRFKTEAVTLEDADAVMNALRGFVASLPDEPIAPPWPTDNPMVEGSLTEPRQDSAL
ncbi:MAG: tRNA dihydrouridine synthase DusB [bacterium]|nr:tRNA dihydrouridine synthase DusB [bacterium]